MERKKTWLIQLNIKAVSVPKAAWNKAQFLKDKIIDGTELSISKVIESIINERAKKHGYKNGKA
jgi:hypothetical protein